MFAGVINAFVDGAGIAVIAVYHYILSARSRTCPFKTNPSHSLQRAGN